MTTIVCFVLIVAAGSLLRFIFGMQNWEDERDRKMQERYLVEHKRRENR